MKYYIDFDGVILDTEKLIFENWHKEEDRSEEAKIRYLQRISWNKIIENSKILKDRTVSFISSSFSVFTFISTLTARSLSSTKISQYFLLKKQTSVPLSYVFIKTGNLFK